MKSSARYFLIALACVTMAACLCSCGGGDPVDTTLIEVAFRSETVSADQGQVFLSVTANGEWKLEIEDADWGELQETSGSGTKNSIILDYQDNPSDKSRALTVKATSGKKSATAVLTQSGYVISTVVTTTTGGVTPSAEYSWMELPATSSSDKLDFIYHMMTLNGAKIRNYSLYWDYDNLVAHWVAYPLNKTYIGSGSRSNAWNVDPLLSTSKQPVLYGAYGDGNNGWYARGHQLPSADRYSGDSNPQTFYGTNMTPQNNDFNSNIWASLESKVRGWAKSGVDTDTLYVATGCVLDGAKYYCLDNLGKKVTVPTGYFKAILRYAPTSTITQSTGGYMGCAFYFEHKNYPSAKDLKSEAMSIDELEKITGIDFFVNLPAAIGTANAAAVESADPTRNSWWGL